MPHRYVIRINKKTRLIMLAILLGPLLIPSLVKADGFGIVYYPDRSSFGLHTEETQVAAINYEDGREKLLLAVKFRELQNNSVVWIIPVPANASDVKINIFKAFPRFSGEDILLQAEEVKGDVTATASLVASLSLIFPIYYVVWFGSLTFTFMGEGEVEVHAHIEKEGVVAEVVTAENANALYDYLKGKNITIAAGSIPIIDDYIGKTYSFVVSWVESIEDETKMPAIFVDFPTDEIYYPLKPTSVYGDAEIPTLIYILGYAKPKLYPEIEPFTEYRYFTGGISGDYPEFYGDAKPSEYTRIIIGRLITSEGDMIGQSSTPPSVNFVDDLWIEKFERPPASVQRAMLTLFIHENMLYFAIGWLIITSLLAGGLTGYLVFRDFKKFALIGLANCFTIVGIIIATFAFVKEKRANFIGIFLIMFLLIDFLVILPVVAILTL